MPHLERQARIEPHAGSGRNGAANLELLPPIVRGRRRILGAAFGRAQFLRIAYLSPLPYRHGHV
jgi:hypothetical protein